MRLVIVAVPGYGNGWFRKQFGAFMEKTFGSLGCDHQPAAWLPTRRPAPMGYGAGCGDPHLLRMPLPPKYPCQHLLSCKLAVYIKG